MGRKFESELAEKVAQHRGRPADRRTRVLLAALLSCVVVIASAATVFSIKAMAAQGGPTEFDVVLGPNVDYLVSSGGDDPEPVYTDVAPEGDDFLVKRAWTLKVTEFVPPGKNEVVYTKFLYTMSIKLRDMRMFGDEVQGMMVSELTVSGIANDVVYTGATVTVDWLEQSTVSEWYQGVYEDGTLTLKVSLPDDIDYVNHNMVTLSIMWKVAMEDWDGEVVEVGFPELQAAGDDE